MNRIITEAITNIAKKDLPKMQENFNRSLTEKAAAKLEEMKTDMGSKFFR